MSELNFRRPNKKVRPAFTLVEMLVVIAIIAVLAAMAAVGVFKVIGTQRGSNTQTSMRTIQKVLNEHWADVVKKASGETGLEGPYATMNSLFGADPTGGARNQVIWIKMRLMEAFPVTYAEIQSPFPYKNNIIPTNLRKNNGTYLKLLGKLTKDNVGGATESSACLQMALSVTRNGTSLNIDNLGSTNVADTDGDTIPELIDGWGNPFSFYRFPWNNQALQNSNPNPTPYADPLDQKGALVAGLTGNFRTTFENSVHKIGPSPASNTAFFIEPALVSRGPDGVLAAG